MTSAAATAAAHDTALPAYVPPIEPALSLSVISLRLITPLSGKPFARPWRSNSVSTTEWKQGVITWNTALAVTVGFL